jgi:hypothetical protein
MRIPLMNLGRINDDLQQARTYGCLHDAEYRPCGDGDAFVLFSDLSVKLTIS